MFRLWAQGSVKILKLKFRQDLVGILLLMFDRGYKWSWILVEILKLGLVNISNLRFSRDADVWLRFWSWCLVKILKLGLANILSLCLAKILMFGWDLKVNAQSKFRNCLIKICIITCDMNSTLGAVVPLAMFRIQNFSSKQMFIF